MKGIFRTIGLILLGASLLVGILADQLLCLAQTASIRGVSMPRLARVLAAVLCAAIAVTGTANMVQSMPAALSPRMSGFYLEGIQELEANTEPGAVIGSNGGGVVAYFIQDRTIVNLDGLMNTVGYFHLLQQGKASQYLDEIRLDYIYTGEYPFTSSDPYFQFKGRFEKLKAFGGSTLFRWK